MESSVMDMLTIPPFSARFSVVRKAFARWTVWVAPTPSASMVVWVPPAGKGCSVTTTLAAQPLISAIKTLIMHSRMDLSSVDGMDGTLEDAPF
jgi:hypothetical protein